jgi:hypothetical protein
MIEEMYVDSDASGARARDLMPIFGLQEFLELSDTCGPQNALKIAYYLAIVVDEVLVMDGAASSPLRTETPLLSARTKKALEGMRKLDTLFAQYGTCQGLNQHRAAVLSGTADLLTE